LMGLSWDNMGISTESASKTMGYHAINISNI
jgi:hypothetical protein